MRQFNARFVGITHLGHIVTCSGKVVEKFEADFAERFIKTAVDNYKGIDIIVNNAGYTWDGVIQKMTD